MNPFNYEDEKYQKQTYNFQTTTRGPYVDDTRARFSLFGFISKFFWK